MKNIMSIELEKYKDEEKYRKITECVYQDLSRKSYAVTLSCELEDNEKEDTQYPLEDILDKFNVHCTEYREIKTDGETMTYTFELESSLGDDQEDSRNITEAAKLVGKRVYNETSPTGIRLVIE